MKKKTSALPPTGYQVIQIILAESNFKRVSDIDFNKQIEPVYDLKVDSSEVEENKFTVLVRFNLKATQGKKNIFEADFSFVGIFERHGEPELSVESFQRVNAPAIIYPFIREHLSSICMKAGIGHFLLPPANFKQND